MAKTFFVSPGRSYTVTASIGSSVKYPNNSTPIVVIGANGSETFDSTGTEIIVSDDNAKIVQNFSTASVAMDKEAAEQAAQAARDAQRKAEQEAAKAKQEVAEVTEVAWTRGFPVFEWQMDAADDVQLDQLTSFWKMKNVAVLCKGKCVDGLPERVWKDAYNKMGAAAWVNVAFNVAERFRSINNFEKHAPSVENCFYIAPGNGNNGTFSFANALYYKADIKYSNWGGFAGRCRAFEVTTGSGMDTVYFELNVKGNVFRKYGNLSANVLRICKSRDDALRMVIVPDGTWENAVDARWAFEGAKSLPERYVPDALPKLVRGGGMFHGCNLSAAKSISILNSLQQNTGSTGADNWLLTMGIHIDHQADEEVLAAINTASTAVEDGGKGWQISVQWNGTATATTFSLRPSQPLPVYAKVETYQREDGTEEQTLSWCHEVFTPNGKEPEELGYTLFESVEAAREHFNLTEPEEYNIEE